MRCPLTEPTTQVPPFLTPIPADKMEKRGWKTIMETRSESGVITEHELTQAVGLSIRHEKMGLELRYGQTSLGYDGLAFHEPGGGGTVIVPYAFFEGQLVVGVLQQKRPLQDREFPVRNIPRGFAAPNEKPFITAQREAGEELEFREDQLMLHSLPGDPINPNSTFFDTAGAGEGVKFYGLEIPTSAIEDKIENEQGILTFRAGVLAPNTESRAAKVAEQILSNAYFIPAKSALLLADNFTVGGVARLLVFLECIHPVSVMPNNELHR